MGRGRDDLPVHRDFPFHSIALYAKFNKGHNINKVTFLVCF